MNYTSIFVIFSAVGVLVFVGIFGAAWLSATEPRTHGDRIPVAPPPLPGESPEPSTTASNGQDSATTQLSHTLSSHEVTSWTDESPGLTRSGSDSLTTKHSQTSDSQENISWTDGSPSLTTDGSDSSTPQSSQDYTSPFSKQPREKSPKFPGILNDPSKSSRADPPSNTDDCETTEISSTVEKGEIKSEVYYNENTCKRWLVKYEEGYNVDITVERLDLDGNAGDYVLISPDEYTENDKNNPILSWKITELRKYKMFGNGGANIKFVTYESPELESNIKENTGFRIIFSRSGELTTTELPTTISPIPSPDTKESIVVSIGVRSFTEQEVQFKTVMATQANTFCEKQNITLITPATYENVYISSLTKCLPSWYDGQNQCITLTMAIPVDTGNSKKYELKKENLQKMWDEWSGDVGITKITGPNYKHNVIIYSIICLVFIIIFSLFLVFVWKWQIRNTFIQKETKARSSAPIEVPPLFDYLDTRLDDVPEYMPYYDSMYQMGTETSTDYITSYGTQPYNQRTNNFGSATFQFSHPSAAGIDNTSFIPEEDEEEYEIMNRASLTQEVKKMSNETESKSTELHGTSKEDSSS